MFRCHSGDHPKKVKDQFIDLVLGNVSMKFIQEKYSDLIAIDFSILDSLLYTGDTSVRIQ